MLSFLATNLGIGRARPRSLELDTGERVLLDDVENGQRVQLVSAAGELLFEYDPVARTTRVSVPDGDLKLEAPRGRIDLDAAKGIGVRSQREVTIKGDAGVELESRSQTSVRLRPHALDLEAPRVAVSGRRGELRLEVLSYAGRRLRAVLEEADVAVGTLQTAAQTVRLRAKNLYQTVEGLVQTRTKRLRTIVSESAHISGRDLYLRAERDTKIDGGQIHLG